nr:hypothetical protein [Lachnospiraceae bacterium]
MKKHTGIAVLLIFALMAGLTACAGSGVADTTAAPDTGAAEEVTEGAAEEAEEDAAGQETADETEDSLVGINQIVNGDFSNGLENWNTYLNHGGTCDFTNEDEQGKIDISAAGATDYGVQIYYDGFKLD